MRKSFLTATLLATAASFAAAPVAPSYSAEPTFDLSISGTGKGFVVYHNGKKSHAATNCSLALNPNIASGSGTPHTCPRMTDNLTQVFDVDNLVPVDDSPAPLLSKTAQTVATVNDDFIILTDGKEASTSPYHNPEIVIDSNIVFSASMMHEGWKYAAYLRIDAFNKDTSLTGGTNDMTQGDIFFLSLGHEDMGTLYLGARPGASTTKWIYMPGAGAYSFNESDATQTHSILTNGGELPWWSAKFNKVMYVSPDFNGFSFAASYTPHKDDGKDFGAPSKKDLVGSGINVIEVQGMFVMDGLKVSAGFANQDANASKSWSGTPAVDNSFNVLASYSMDGLTIGAGYQTHPNFTQDKWTIYGGAEYAFTDDWSFGAGYLTHDDHTNSGSDLIVANVNYAMTKKASWNTGVTIPTTGDNWSIATGFVYKFGPNT